MGREEKMKTVKVLAIVLAGMFFTTSFGLQVWAFNPQPEPPGKPISLLINGPDQLKLEGAITKIEGSNITLRDGAGKLHTIGVRAESQEDKARFGRLQVGGNVKIEGGRMMFPQR